MDDETTRERFSAIERRLNQLADMIEMLAKERHDRLGHAKPFGDVASHSANQSCDDPWCREIFEVANLEVL